MVGDPVVISSRLDDEAPSVEPPDEAVEAGLTALTERWYAERGDSTPTMDDVRYDVRVVLAAALPSLLAELAGAQRREQRVREKIEQARSNGGDWLRQWCWEWLGDLGRVLDGDDQP